MQKMDAIKIATNRLDGKLKTPIRIEYPKVFMLYPYATGSTAPEPPRIAPPPEVDAIIENKPLPVVSGELIEAPDIPQAPEKDLATMGLRETMAEMSDFPRELPEGIIALALQTEQWVRKKAPKPHEIPKVKSVVAAHLLTMAQNRNMDAIGEVFDAIDGKLVETLQILGEDLYITSYATTAPAGAIKNKDGVLQIEATDSQNTWAQKLGKELQ